jgi:hypothetical protein
MIRLAVTIAVVCVAALAVSCVTQATDQEIGEMCKTLVGLRGEVDTKSLDELTARIEDDYAQRAKRMEGSKAREIEMWDKELAAKLKEAEGAEEKPGEEELKQLKDDFAKKKADVEARYADEVKKLGPSKKAALEEAAKKVDKAQAEFDQAVAECVAEAAKEGVAQQIAQCRAKATSTDQYWNQCR